MKNLLTMLVLASLIFIIPNYQVRAQKTKENTIKEVNLVPTQAETVKQLEKIDRIKKANSSLKIAIGTGAAGIALYIASNSGKFGAETGTRKYVERMLYDAYYAEKKPLADGRMTINNSDLKEYTEAVARAKKLEPGKVPSDFKIETEEILMSTAANPQGEKVLAAFKVSLKEGGKFTEATLMPSNLYKIRVHDRVSSTGKINTESWVKVFRNPKNIETAQKMKIGGYALIGVSFASLLYSSYQLWIADDPKPSVAKIDADNFKALADHDYSKPLPSNLVQILQDEKVRTSIGMVSMGFDDLEAQGAFKL